MYSQEIIKHCYKQNDTSTSPESDFLRAFAMTSASSDKAWKRGFSNI